MVMELIYVKKNKNKAKPLKKFNFFFNSSTFGCRAQDKSITNYRPTPNLTVLLSRDVLTTMFVSTFLLLFTSFTGTR